MYFVMRENLQFHRDDADISIWSDQLALYFQIPHQEKLIPLIEKTRKGNEQNFEEAKYWDSRNLKMQVRDYRLNKAACRLICKKIKSKAALRERFLKLIEAVEHI